MDPLRSGGAFDDQDMEDLTAHLAALPGAGAGAGRRRSSHDGLDLGDNSELLQGNMDRFRALAGDDPHDDLFASFGGLGRGLGPLGHPVDPADAAGAASVIYTTNYPTYGELAAAKPPSYEDSVMYEQALPSMHAASAVPAGGAAGAYQQQGHPASGPLGPLGDHAAAAPSAVQAAQPGHTVGQGPGPELSPANGAAAAGPGGYGQGPLGPASTAAAGGAAAAQAAGAAARSAQGAGRQAGVSAPRPSLLVPTTSLDYPESDTLSPQLSPPAHPHPQPHAHAALLAPSSSRGAGLVISVGEPVKREQGGLFGIKGGYVTYLVRSKCRQPGPGSLSRPEAAVRRRFREFVALADLLKAKYRGYFVPPRPEKNAVEGQRMADSFVEERRLALERYLNKLAQHPVIGRSEELRQFLESECELADSPAWLALRPAAPSAGLLDGTARFSKQLLGLDRAVLDPVQAAQPTKKAADFMRAIKETARSMQVPSASLPADEVALQRGREEVEALQGALTGASRAAEKLVSRLDRWSVVAGELGMSLFQLSRAEEEEGVPLASHTGTLKQSGGLMHDTKRAGTALVRASRVGRKVTGRCAIELGCLHEYLGIMPAALKGLRSRDKALLTADTLQADLEGRRRAITELEAAGARVLGGSEAKARKVADLSGDVAVLEQSIVAARAQYDKIKQTNQEELVRLRSELVTDMGAMLGQFAKVMCANANRQLEIWLLAAHELGASPEQLQEAKAPLGVAAPALHASPHSPQRQRHSGSGGGGGTAAAGAAGGSSVGAMQPHGGPASSVGGAVAGRAGAGAMLGDVDLHGAGPGAGGYPL